MFDIDDYIQSQMPHSAYSASVMRDKLENAKRQEEIKEQSKIERQNAPLIKELQTIVAKTQEQNKKLSEQIKLQKEEIKRQKQDIERVRKSERRANIRSWISIGVAIISLVATIVIAIVK